MKTKFPAVVFLPVALCCATMIAFAQQPATPSETPKNGSIKGRVTGNDGQPLASIPVMAIPFGRSGIRRQGPGQPMAMPSQTVTDDEGNFEFPNLAPASYFISASIPGYVAPMPEGSEGEEATGNLYRLGEFANITLVKGGVITGKVHNANGEPLTGVNVSAIRIGNVNGETDELSAARSFGRNWRTDDRGVYRIYGLIPGSYIVQAGQMGDQGRALSPYREDAPTYYPSSARDAAIPLAVRPGDELTGVDIRYRADKGHSVGGRAVIAATANKANNQTSNNDFGGMEILLNVAGTDSVVATTFQSDRSQTRGFAFYNIPDGEYELSARRGVGATESDLVSEPRHVSVRGADVSGVQLSLTPLALLSGKVTLEHAAANSAAACPSPRRSFTEEVLLSVHHVDAANDNRKSAPLRPIAPSPSGDFLFRNLEAGRWRLSVNLPDETWYVRSIQSGSPATPTAATATRKTAPAMTAAANLGRSGALLKSGEKLTNVTITIAEGAAGLKGSLSESGKGKMQIHLIPAEKEYADDVLRYAQTNTTGEGSFQFKNITPGKYLLLAKPAKDDSNKLSWDAAQRATLRKEAEAAGNAVELAACQRHDDFKLSVK
ncbi:MAG: carboxypeptidase regulatory-like domain-containing protein [Acidobacteria bacterium]|nr:carboxypeptidase regulatory-like domain-containing protein [Acidobacteriota bacterium]